MEIEYLNPIPDCSYHNEVDTLCTHPDNITPECHSNCCPRLSKQVRFALDVPAKEKEKSSFNSGDLIMSMHRSF